MHSSNDLPYSILTEIGRCVKNSIGKVKRIGLAQFPREPYVMHIARQVTSAELRLGDVPKSLSAVPLSFSSLGRDYTTPSQTPVVK